ncbi:MAG: hypothetical protein KDK66_03710, partial [Deltaproteobacteria bacterium]|nr:hypothetical protein [Deltaproteobacteria bacterium]
MKSLNPIFLFLWIILLSIVGFFSPVQAGTTGLSTIKQILNGIVGDGSDPWIMVELSASSFHNPAGCPAPNQFYALDPSESHYDDTYATLLTAYMTKSKVEFF